VVVPLDRGVDGIAILASLRDAYPTCYRFLIEDGRGNAFLGASPERLVRLAQSEILTDAVAGTQRCEPGDDAAALAQALLRRSKDRSEHTIVLQHLFGILDPICETLGAPETPDVMKLPHLLHLRTAVRGRARPGAHVLDLVSRLHPTPAVAGWPRPEAMDWIREVEGGERGWYAGPIGWVNAAGEGDFAVGIRSVAIRGRSARLFAGAGIVEGSDPELEWSETELKMKGVLDAIARD
jgi:isochorismate synthase